MASPAPFQTHRLEAGRRRGRGDRGTGSLRGVGRGRGIRGTRCESILEFNPERSAGSVAKGFRRGSHTKMGSEENIF